MLCLAVPYPGDCSIQGPRWQQEGYHDGVPCLPSRVIRAAGRGLGIDRWSRWRDLNPRPSAPEADALARLRYTSWMTAIRLDVLHRVAHDDFNCQRIRRRAFASNPRASSTRSRDVSSALRAFFNGVSYDWCTKVKVMSQYGLLRKIITSQPGKRPSSSRRDAQRHAVPLAAGSEARDAPTRSRRDRSDGVPESLGCAAACVEIPDAAWRAHRRRAERTAD